MICLIPIGTKKKYDVQIYKIFLKGRMLFCYSLCDKGKRKYQCIFVQIERMFETNITNWVRKRVLAYKLLSHTDRLIMVSAKIRSVLATKMHCSLISFISERTSKSHSFFWISIIRHELCQIELVEHICVLFEKFKSRSSHIFSKLWL